MRGVELTKKLKDALEVKSNEDVLQAVEQLLARRQPVQPQGVLLVMDPDSGTYWPTTFGLEQEVSVTDLERLRNMCVSFADRGLGETISRMMQEKIAALEAQLLESREADSEEEK